MAKEKKNVGISKDMSKASMKDAKHMNFYPEYQNLYGIECCSRVEDCVVRPFLKIDDDLPNRA